MVRDNQSWRAARPSASQVRQASVIDRMVCRPSVGCGDPLDQACVFQRGDDRPHRLRAHAFHSRQRRGCRWAVIFQAQQHRSLRRRQVADIGLLAQPPLQFACQRSHLASQGIGVGRGFSRRLLIHAVVVGQENLKVNLISLTDDMRLSEDRRALSARHFGAPRSSEPGIHFSGEQEAGWIPGSPCGRPGMTMERGPGVCRRLLLADLPP